MVIKRVCLTKDETKNNQNFLLNVPAGEDSLAHRGHVCSRLILQSPDLLTQQLDIEEVFERKAPLHVDLGCGDGSFLCALARRMSDKNFLGIERLQRRIRSSAHKAAELKNVRLLQMESAYAVRYLLPPGSVETFYLLFPDPWPKRRHHDRRIVTLNFLNSLHTALKKTGIIHIATDHLDYFQRIEQFARLTSGFAIADADVDLPASKFGLIFQQKCAPIHWLALRKISPVI